MCMFRASRRPSGRQEAVQLMRIMDDMLMKAGVDQKSEDLTELSQVRQTDKQRVGCSVPLWLTLVLCCIHVQTICTRTTFKFIK